MHFCDRRLARLPTYTVRARSQPIAFRPQLVALIARATDAAPDRGSRCGLFTDSRPRLGRGIAATRHLEGIILLCLVLLRRHGVQLCLARELQLLEGVLRALCKRIETRMLRLGDMGRRSRIGAGMV